MQFTEELQKVMKKHDVEEIRMYYKVDGVVHYELIKLQD